MPEDSRVRAVDSASGDLILIDPDHFVSGAGWSPDGSALVYSVNSRLDEHAKRVVYYRSAGDSRAFAAGRRILPGDFLQRKSLHLGREQTMLLSLRLRRASSWYIWNDASYR